jgi:hypothetical protein
MASPVGTLRVDLAANTAQFAAGMEAARSKIVQFQQAGAKASSGARGLGTEFSRMGQAVSSNRFAVQNAAYQLGDFAVQVAGGTSATRALAQQLPQLLGGFGVFGAVAGAAFAILAPLVGKLFEGADAASEFARELDGINPSLQSVRSGVSELRDIQLKYVAAIGEAGGASSGAASLVVANTKREFEARKQILAVELEILRIRNQEKSTDISTIQSQIDVQARAMETDIANIKADLERGGVSEGNASRYGRTNPFVVAAQDAFLKRTEQDRLVVRKLRAELKLSELAAEELAAALDTTFNDVGGGGGSVETGGGGGGGGSGRSMQAKQLAEDMREASKEAEYFNSLQDDMKQGFLDAIIEGKNFGDVIDDIAKSLARAALESALFNTGPFGVSGGGGGLLGALFGGFRAGGGPVSGGTAYVVGERGPELFVPTMGGQIVPNDAIGGGGSVDVRVFVDEGGNWQGAVQRISGQVSSAMIVQNNKRVREAQRR